MPRVLIGGWGCLMLCTSSVMAFMSADIDAAKGLVAERCISCHEAPGIKPARQTAASDTATPALSLVMIAGDPALQALEPLKAALAVPHWPDESFELKGTDLDNVVGYILSLSKE